MIIKILFSVTIEIYKLLLSEISRIQVPCERRELVDFACFAMEEGFLYDGVYILL